MLKSLSDLVKPDSRQSYFQYLDTNLGANRPLTLEDLFAEVQAIQLHGNVPEVIRSHFATALNLAVYSWYFYPFNVTAEFMAYVSVEFALRHKFSVQTQTPFKHLVKRAIDEKLIKANGFSDFRARNICIRGCDVQGDSVSDPTRIYVEILMEAMPYLRNNLTHGNSMIHMEGVHKVQLCADFINQLFEVPQNYG